jgi:16S rRNA (uracil1498-N3)-methyltransferase
MKKRLSDLPYFYMPALNPGPGLAAGGPEATLDEATSRHCIQVLRMRTGDPLLLTDGQGHESRATIRTPDKRHCVVSLEAQEFRPRTGPDVHIALSPLKNAHRYEWFLEKATEIGVAVLTPLLTERMERDILKPERLRNILISAMLQSRQVWLPKLEEPTELNALLDQDSKGRRFIAHLVEGERKHLRGGGTSTILIGPEGDFTPGEVEKALSRGWDPVSLGENRLRTETAGIVAAALLRLG